MKGTLFSLVWHFELKHPFFEDRPRRSKSFLPKLKVPALIIIKLLLYVNPSSLSYTPPNIKETMPETKFEVGMTW